MRKILALFGLVAVLAMACLVIGTLPVGDPRAHEVSLVVTEPVPETTTAPAFETTAREAIVVDANTGTILFDKNADNRMPTASMSKVMTLYMIFEALEKGQISLSDTFTVSEKAWRKGGSKMFVEVGDKVSVEDLIHGVAIQSGNDASIVLAEGLAGSEEEFARLMTIRAHEMGMTNSNFVNASGWPDPNHYSTARDLAILSYRLIHDFPEHYPYFAQREFTYNNITQQNRDPLLGRLEGADGIKTGHTEEAGYGLMGSALRDGRRVIMVVNGLPSMRARTEESVRIMEWAFRNFTLTALYRKGDEVARLPVWLGTSPDLSVVTAREVSVLLPRVGAPVPGQRIIFDAPLRAPIVKGEEVGRLIVTVPGQDQQTVPLFAAVDMPREGVIGRSITRVRALLGVGGVMPAASAGAVSE